MSEIVKIQQTVIPQKVYIGDTVTIQCLFNSASQDIKTNGIGIENFIYPVNQDSIEIQKVDLQVRGPDYYNLVITLIPWQTGQISIPDISFENEKYLIQFNSFYVSSLLSGKEDTQLRKIQTPQLLPGTTYVLYGSIVSFIILLIILLNLIIRHKKVMAWFKEKRKEFFLKKNKKQALKTLTELENKKLPQKDSAKIIQETARKYLEVRLEKNFTKFTTSQIKFELTEIPENQKKDLIELFVNTDVVRYGKDDSCRNFEVKDFCTKLKNVILEIEKYFYEELKKKIEAGVM